MRRVAVILAAMVSALFAEASRPADIFIFNDVGAGPYIARYAQTLCAMAGIQCEVLQLPLRRAVRMMRDGTLDGELGRISSFAEITGTQNVYHRIDIPFLTLNTYFYTLAGRPRLDDWSDLKSEAGAIGYRRGAIDTERHLDELGLSSKTVPVESGPQCMEMLLARRVDACIFTTPGNLVGREACALEAAGRIQRGETVGTIELFPYVNAARKGAIPLIAEAAEKIRKTGADRQILEQLETEEKRTCIRPAVSSRRAKASVPANP